MSLKSKIPHCYYVTLTKLCGNNFPDYLHLTNKSEIAKKEDESKTYEIIAYHGLASDKLIKKFSTAEYGGSIEDNELNSYLDGKGSLNYDKGILGDFILIVLGMIFTITIFYLWSKKENIYSGIKTRIRVR